MTRSCLLVAASTLLLAGPTSAQNARVSLPRLDSAGIVQNAEELSAKQVIGKRVLCPACRSLVFKAWPEGWDSHAERRCRGLSAKGGTERKEEFRRKYGYLFRS